jgi:hypothetical protein
MSDTTPEQAYRAEYMYKGQVLKPFSFVRETAAYALGWKIHIPEQDDDNAANVAPLLFDAIIVIWLCLQPDSVVQRARRKPEEHIQSMDRWAEAEKISLMSESGQAAIKAYSELLTDYFSSQSAPDVDQDQTEDPN